MSKPTPVDKALAAGAEACFWMAQYNDQVAGHANSSQAKQWRESGNVLHHLLGIGRDNLPCVREFGCTDPDCETCYGAEQESSDAGYGHGV